MTLDLVNLNYDDAYAGFGDVGDGENRITLSWDEWIELDRPTTIRLAGA